MKQISYNRQVSHDYFIEDTLTCGIILKGNEVKSLRQNGTSLKGTWCTIQNSRLVIRGMNIKNWGTSNAFDLPEEGRERELLVNKKELVKLLEKIKEKGYTLVPISIYFNERSLVKVDMGICKGKHNYDKRADLKTKQVKRDIDRELRERNK